MADSTVFKRQKAATTFCLEVGRISTLPDCLLIHIPSFLPTKTSVTTSLLSRRWRHIWKHLSVLYFSDYHFEHDYDFEEWHDARFQLFKTLASSINSMFLLRMPYKVQKMRLSCRQSLVDEEFCTSSVNNWVQSVIGPHLKELDLTLYSIDTYNFKLPIATACINLVSLSLEGAMDFDLQCFKGILLPSLKKLKLFIWDMEMPSINALISICPILETLEIYISVEDYKTIRVPPTLKTVKIINRMADDKPSIELSSLVFDNLNITQITFGDVGNLKNVVKASLDVFPSSSYSSALHVDLLMLLTALSGIKHVALSNSATKEQSPALSGLATQPSVPRCIVSCLTFIQFKGYRGFPDELLFVEYILQKGLTMKTMIIANISVDQTKKYNILKRLSKVSRASGVCELIFD